MPSNLKKYPLQFAALVGGSLLAILAGLLAERIELLPPGTAISIFEIVAEFAGCWFCLVRLQGFERLPRLALAVFFFFMGFADAAYAYFYYFQGLTAPTLMSTGLTQIPYGVANVAFITFVISNFSRPLGAHFKEWTALVPLLALIPLIYRLGLPLFRITSAPYHNPWTLIFEAFSLVSAYMVFYLSMLGFSKSRETRLTGLAAGPVLFLVADWAIKVEKFMGRPITFFVYEYLWAFGVFLTVFSLLIPLDDERNFGRYETRHLSSKTRTAVLLLSAAVLIVLGVVNHERLDLVRYLTVFFAFGVLAAAFLSLSQNAALRNFALSLSQAIERFGVTQSEEDQMERQVPKELENLIQRAVLNNQKNWLQQQELEARLAVAQGQAELARRVAHDIRSPIAALQVALQSLDKDPAGSQELLRDATQRIQEIANDLLERYRNNAAAAVTAHDLVPLVRAVVDEKRAEWKHRIEFRLAGAVANGNGVAAQVDGAQFKRVLSNLLNNAAEALPRNRQADRQVVVELANDPQWAVLRIADNGCGIPQEVLPQLMQPGASFGKPHGSGLGLYFSKKFVQAWGGEIEVNSKPGQGTVVQVRMRVEV